MFSFFFILLAQYHVGRYSSTVRLAAKGLLRSIVSWDPHWAMVTNVAWCGVLESMPWNDTSDSTHSIPHVTTRTSRIHKHNLTLLHTIPDATINLIFSINTQNTTLVAINTVHMSSLRVWAISWNDIKLIYSFRNGAAGACCSNPYNRPMHSFYNPFFLTVHWRIENKLSHLAIQKMNENFTAKNVIVISKNFTRGTTFKESCTSTQITLLLSWVFTCVQTEKRGTVRQS